MPKKVKSTRKTFPTKIKVYPLNYKGLLNDPNRPNKDEYEVKENLPHLSYNQPQTGEFGGYNHYELYHEENVKNLVERSGLKETFAKVVGQYNKNVEDETKLLQYKEDLKEDLASYKDSNKLLEEKIDSKDFSSNIEAFRVNKIAGDTPKTSIKFITDMLVRYDSLKPITPDTNWFGDYEKYKDKLTFPLPEGPKDDKGINKNAKTLHATGYWSKGPVLFGGYDSHTNVNAYLAFDNLVDELLKNDKGLKESIDKTHQELVPLKDELIQEMTRHDNLILGYKDRKPIIPQPKIDDNIDNVSVININEQRNINDDLLSKYGDNKSVLDLKEALANKAQPKITQQQYLDVSASRLKDETQQQSAIDFSVIQQQNIEDKKQDQSVNAIRDLKSALDSPRYIALFDAANRLKRAKKVYKSRPVVYQYAAPSRIKPKELDLRTRFNLMID